MNAENSMDRIVNYIGFFYIFSGISTTVLALLTILSPTFVNIFSAYTSMFGFYPSNTYFLIFDIAIGISSLLVGIGLLSRTHLSRIGAIILAIPELISIPYGLILGIFIIVMMVIPTANSVFGKFSHKKLPYRIIGILLIAISFFAFAGLSGYVDMNEVSTDISMSVAGIPQCNIAPQDKIHIDSNDLQPNNDVIVELTAPIGKYAIEQQSQIYTQLEDYGNVINTYTHVYNGVHMDVSREQLENLASNPYVEGIYKNEENKLYYSNPITDVYGLDDSNNLLNTKWLWEHGYKGQGVAVAIVDTGINENMSALQRNGSSVVIASYEKYGKWVHWHGTATASCVASQDKTYSGVAPMADLINVEVFTTNGDGDVVAYDSDVLWGFEKVAEFKQSHPDYFVIASCSFGIPAELVQDTWSHPYPTSRGADNLATQYGIPVVASAGNDATSGFKISAPASAQYVLAVGAVDKNLNYAWFSSQGPTPDGHKKPDVTNIGVDVKTFDPDGNLIVVDGTSFSCPLTAGILADIASKNKDKGYTPTDYYNALKRSARDIAPAGFDYKTGYGFVDGEKASEIIGHIPAKEVFAKISFAMIFVGAGVAFFPEWASKLPEERRRKWRS